MGRWVVLAVLLAAASCVTVSKTVLQDRSAAPVPTGDVLLLLPGDAVPEGCERVAILHASGDEDLTDETDIYNKFREEAGKLGANAVEVRTMEDPGTGERVASALLGTESDRDSEAIALFCP
ncbi:MAG: hypothetical protein HKN73_00315 [Gemmatimonadetes bacterium]|nr:hypothetical protein [Gemmatimonadota bacterium]